MAKIASLCMITLLLSLTLHNALARPDPTFRDVTPMEARDKVDVEEAKGGIVDEEGCDGVGEEECMTRRTLQAHLDYIYTQNKQP